MRQLRLTMFTGRSLLDIAAEKVRMFAERHDPRRLYVFFSGGKDSAAALAAVVYAGDSIVRRMVIVYNEIVGNTAGLNVETVYRVAESIGVDVVRVESPPGASIRSAVEGSEAPLLLHIAARSHRTGLTFPEMLVKYGPPTPSPSRWCYTEFKEKHWRELPPDVVGGTRVRYSIVGVKTVDSRGRRRQWRGADTETWSMVFDWRRNRIPLLIHSMSPVLHMTDDEVWMVLREAGLHAIVRRAYDEAGDSLNCSLCPLRPVEKQARVFRWLRENEPTLYETLRDALLKAEPRGKHTAKIHQRMLEALHLAENTNADPQ